MTPTPGIGIALSGHTDKAIADRLRHLANQLEIPPCALPDNQNSSQPECSDFSLYLQINPTADPPQLELCSTDKSLGKPLSLDFVHGALAHRRRFGGGRGQPLARAMGLKNGVNPLIVDATGGTGKDAFVLASLGAEVILIERSAILAALLQDALDRAALDSSVAEIVARIQLIQTDAIDWLSHCQQRPDMIYMDPMYPHRSKSALVKKEMRILRSLVGDDTDSGQLLAAALNCAKKRVVVKRPKGAEIVNGPALNNQRPSSAIESKNTRYDLYSLT